LWPGAYKLLPFIYIQYASHILCSGGSLRIIIDRIRSSFEVLGAADGVVGVWVPGAGHNSNTDAPGFVNAQIECFLEALS
jgi:pimeloyl-ACP methyl ester carboxylesterase